MASHKHTATRLQGQRSRFALGNAVDVHVVCWRLLTTRRNFQCGSASYLYVVVVVVDGGILRRPGAPRRT
eukprot:5072387-Amphidinium_carterae.1